VILTKVNLPVPIRDSTNRIGIIILWQVILNLIMLSSDEILVETLSSAVTVYDVAKILHMWNVNCAQEGISMNNKQLIVISIFLKVSLFF